MIRKAAEIRRVLERSTIMWRNGDFDLLLLEAIRCDKLLKNTQRLQSDGSLGREEEEFYTHQNWLKPGISVEMCHSCLSGRCCVKKS